MVRFVGSPGVGWMLLAFMVTVMSGSLALASPPEEATELTSTETAAAQPAAQDPPAEPAPAAAPASSGPTNAELKVMADTVWVMVAGMLVFFMNLGFACVESGFCRAKNCVNILSKNFIVFAVAAIAYWLLGWGIMFGDGNKFMGLQGLWMVNGGEEGPYGSISWANIPLWAKFFFQLVFAGTAATIVSGAVAERIKYHSFIVFSAFMALCIYPVVGHWIWGGGWLAERGFVDFAGSTQVHSVGGWAALVGAALLGPRLGKYSAEGKPQAIPGHNMTAATIGCFVLWFGWFGFNPGSTMGVDPGAIAEIAVTTNAAAAAATLSATVAAWLMLGKPDLGMTLNGCLAGLVAITAPCAFVTTEIAVLIGLVAGVLVVLAVMGFDRIRIDDPVGATSVHLVNGVFGTLCVGLFGHPDRIGRSGNTAHKAGLIYTGDTEQLIDQLIGVGAAGAYVLVASVVVWAIIKATMGMRVKQEEEIEGLDAGEHGNEAYHGFVLARAYE